MNKPQDFDTAPEYGASLPAGGYVCKILNVEETTSKTKGEPMIKISLDICEGSYKDFFANQYRADTRPDKKWSGNAVINQLVYDPVNKNSTNKGFKTFITAVTNSNSGFAVKWGNAFCSCLKGKLVGVLFRREQFISENGDTPFATKAFMFRSVDTIRNGVPVPEDKLLDNSSQQAGYAPQSQPQNPYVNPDLSDFEEVISDDELPF